MTQGCRMVVQKPPDAFKSPPNESSGAQLARAHCRRRSVLPAECRGQAIEVHHHRGDRHLRIDRGFTSIPDPAHPAIDLGLANSVLDRQTPERPELVITAFPLLSSVVTSLKPSSSSIR